MILELYHNKVFFKINHIIQLIQQSTPFQQSSLNKLCKEMFQKNISGVSENLS